MIFSLLKDSADGFGAVAVHMIQRIINKIPEPFTFKDEKEFP